MSTEEKETHSRAPRAAKVALIAVGLLLVTAQLSHAGNTFSDGRHWGQGGLSREFVTIVDNTSSAWPVYAAAIEWDSAPRLDVVYAYGSCSGSPGHCIGVQVLPMSDFGNNLCQNYGGFAVVNTTSSGHINPDTSYIRFNGNCNTSGFDNRDRRALACEEEGHILGLHHAWVGHGGSYGLEGSTCMASGDIRNLHEKPRPHDFNTIDSLYTHSH